MRSRQHLSEQALIEYFAKRAAEEGGLSLAASDPSAALVHSELADRYRRLASQFEAKTGDDPR